jgi:hypothetical protein
MSIARRAGLCRIDVRAEGNDLGGAAGGRLMGVLDSGGARQ